MRWTLEGNARQLAVDAGLTLVGLLFLLGSLVYVGSPSFSGTNLIAVIALPLVAWELLRTPLAREAVPAVAAAGLLLAIALVVVVARPSPENARLVRGILVAIVGAVGARWMARSHPLVSVRVVKAGLVAAAGVALLQGTYLLIGVGLDPRLEERLLEGLASGVLSIGLPSFFGNSNNFSVFAGLAMVYFGVTRAAGWRWQVLALACVLASGSRTVLASVLLWLAARLIKRFRAMGVPLAITGAVLAWTGLIASGGDTGIYFLDRFYVAVTEILAGSTETGGSFDVRTQAHRYALLHYPNFLIGSFDATDPYPSFRNTTFDDSLIRVNPHSFIIELHALFGVFGLVGLLLLGISLLAALWRANGPAMATVLVVVVALLSTVPSSILQFQSFFVLVTLLAIGRPGAVARVQAALPPART